MTQGYVEAHLRSLSDDELLNALSEAMKDLSVAANTEPNSEWHESCFAATALYAQEVSKRKLNKTH